MNKNVNQIIPVADFLGSILGENTEIIVHDLSSYNQSIVHIINGHISNRKIGDPITDLVVEFITNEAKGDKQFICNYNSKTINDKLLYSSTYFIKDDKKNIVGALCLNSDYSGLNKSLSFLTGMLPNYINDKTVALNNIKENLNSNPTELTNNKIDQIIEQFDVTPNRMTTAEKTEIISSLNDCGIFNIRGSVPEVAEKLNMSEPSVYRYIKKIKKLNDLSSSD